MQRWQSVGRSAGPAVVGQTGKKTPYSLLWQHVPTYFGNLETINIKLIKVLYEILLDGINN
jgi:hypothetical protein